MPQLIEHIDALARRLKRDVLYLEFHPEQRVDWRHYDYESDANRARVLDWLDRNGFAWGPCGDYARPGYLRPYLGQICLDVAYDEALAEYGKLRDYLELPDGTMRQPGVRFCVQPLDHAQQNAEHDEPGFWERWAADF